jgi:hypothetical protein
MAKPARTLEVTDPHQLRALAHPLRLRLLRLVREHRPVTGARLAELVGESTASVSYHLSVLAKHGFVEPDPSPAETRRHKPWRTTFDALRITGQETDRPPIETVEGAVLTALLGQTRADQDAYLAGSEDLSPEWLDSATFQLTRLTLTVEELDRMSAEVEAVLTRYRGPDGPDLPEGRARFSVSFVAVPTADRSHPRGGVS